MQIDYKKLSREVNFKGEADEFKEAFGIENKEHPELDDLTVAHIVADHIRKDSEYYEKEEKSEDDDGEFEKENDSDKTDSEEMAAEFNKILKSKMAGKGE